MLHFNKNRKRTGGFTMVELMVVLTIMAILAALVGGGLNAYIRLARFEKNEANARTLFQAAQISLTRMDTAGELDAFCEQVGALTGNNGHFTGSVDILDDNGNVVRTRTQDELNRAIYALYYDKSGAGDDNQNAMVEALLGDYIYDKSLLNAAVCVEIDRESGQVYSVFYDTNSEKLRFGKSGATDITDRSYDHRRNDSLVGYYSAEDRVNVVELQQTKLKVKNPRLSNGETLTLSWGGNSNLNDMDTVYTATAYRAANNLGAYVVEDDTKPLFKIDVKLEANQPDIAQLVTHFYNDDGTEKYTKTIGYPITYNHGNFVLTLDAMADADVLRNYENNGRDPEKADLYSITRLLAEPTDIIIRLQASPREEYADSYTDSKTEDTNAENTLFTLGDTKNTAKLKYFRHLYNVRWAEDWNVTQADYTLTAQDSSSANGLNWTGGGVTVYCSTGSDPVAKVPTQADPVAWPTIPTLGKNITLTSETTPVTGTTRVPLLNLQLRGSSVAGEGRGKDDDLKDRYVGLIGENDGTIKNITLRDADVQVNAEVKTIDADEALPDGAVKLAETLTTTTCLAPLDETDNAYRAGLRAVGALCGVNTGTLENCALTHGTNNAVAAQVTAALELDNETTVKTRDAQNKTLNGKAYTYYENEPRGLGGLVGVAMPEDGKTMTSLTVAENVTVAGLLVDKDTTTTTATTADEQGEQARYAAAADTTEQSKVWRSIGVGGVFGTLDATNLNDAAALSGISNAAAVTGTGFVGGIAGNLYNTGADAVTLASLANTGTVSAGASYQGDDENAAHSLVLGQFFGGIAGYSQNVTLSGCTSAIRSNLTEASLKEQVAAGYDMRDGSLTDASPLKGDFVGGIVGYGKDITLKNCTTQRGYILGNRFVGGIAGGLAGSASQTETAANSSAVFGNRYVGGIVSVNGAASTIKASTNTGLVAGLGSNAAYVGGIAGRSDAAWGSNAAVTSAATLEDCTSSMSGDNATDSRRIELLKALSTHGKITEYANYVGGLVGYNGKDAVVRWTTTAPTLGAILYGESFVGGVAGYNDATAKIENNTTTTLTVRGQVVATGDAVGGVLGMNCAPALPAASVTATRIEGNHFVGGVIGANLPVGSFAVADDGALTTNAASGSIIADGVAGGIIGYNRLLRAYPTGAAPAALLPSIDEKTGQFTAGAGDGGSSTITFTGFTNKLNLYATAYVGGILGYNDDATNLTITGAENGSSSNPLSVGGISRGSAANRTLREGTLYKTAGVSLNTLANGRYDFGETRGALAGGIIGYATANTTLDSCTNYGIVTHACAAGGFAGWNAGTIKGGQMRASLGSVQSGYTYLGGIAGVNASVIENVFPASGTTVSGYNYIGGVAGANLRDASINCASSNTTPAAVQANQYAGGAAGVNAGTITVSGTLSVNVTASRYAGGAAGLNTRGTDYTGTITGEGTGTSTYGSVSGTVTSADYAGGAAGENTGLVQNMRNTAAVRATSQFAGGLAGINNTNGVITASAHAGGSVTAANGEAGGIAGRNAANAQIDNASVTASVTASNGMAGGITASNYGTIGTPTVTGGTVAGCTISGTADSIGAAAACNQQGGTVYRVTLDTGAKITFSTRATKVGGLVGENLGTVADCTVNNNALVLTGLSAANNSVTLGGAVGHNSDTVTDVNVALDIAQNLAKYTNMGGVAGQNDGTLSKCTYQGKLGGDAGWNGDITSGAANMGNTAGGIAGRNNGTVESCAVSKITLQLRGASNVSDMQTAEQKLQNASHVGGVVGRNDGTVESSYVATTSLGGSMIAVRYGFVGGVAGSNSGTITDSGSKQALVDGVYRENTESIVNQVEAWLNGDINAMVDTLTNDDGTYADLRGVDTVSDYNYVYVYADNLNKNDLLVALRGTTAAGNKAIGYLGGITGFNGKGGVVSRAATGHWFVYADNASNDSMVGGAIGRNETEKDLSTIVNCAAVRRFIRVSTTDDNDTTNEKNSSTAYVGGVIGVQNNTTDDQWTISRCVNYGGVIDSRSNFVGGVIASWLKNGGTVKECFNFGDIYTNMNDGGDSGTVGGVIGFFDKPTPGGTANILSCQNHGDIKALKIYRTYKEGDGFDYEGANDIAGIIGKVEMANGDDYMRINIVDCVNGRVTMQCNSSVSGIMGWLGPYGSRDGTVKNPNNVEMYIDRCRNYSTDMNVSQRKYNAYQASMISGICGNRGNGANTNKATTVTNCFALYDKKSSGYDSPIIINRKRDGGSENIVDVGNYYMDEKSFDEQTYTWAMMRLYEDKAIGTKEVHECTTHSNETWVDATLPSDAGKYGKRLFAGIDNTIRNNASNPGADQNYFFAASVPTGQRLDRIDAAKEISYIAGGTPVKTITRDSSPNNDTIPYPLLLWFTNRDDDANPGFNDITDEAIQKYYATVLNSVTPGQVDGSKIIVQHSEESADKANVYGVYNVSWEAPKTKNPDGEEVVTASYYILTIYAVDQQGTEEVMVPLEGYKDIQVFGTRYAFEGSEELEKLLDGRKFVVGIKAVTGNSTPGTEGYSAQTDFMTPMPVPEVEVRLMKETVSDNRNTYDYGQWVILKNADKLNDAVGEGNWEVTVYLASAEDTKRTLTSSNTQAYFVSGLGTATYIRAYTDPKNTATGNKMRSAQYEMQIGVPVTYDKDGTKNSGLVQGTLTSSALDIQGATTTELTISTTLSFAPTQIPTAQPTYRVMLMGLYQGSDTTENGTSLKNQYITLASIEKPVPSGDTEFTFRNLPLDIFTSGEYTDFKVVAVPVNSGLGPAVTRWDATTAEADTAINAANGRTANWTQGLEIVRGDADEDGKYSYTYVNMTPFRFFNDSDSWSYMARNQIKQYDLSLSVLQAPTLPPTIADGVVDKSTNKLTYTFTWTQDDLQTTDKDPDYDVKLYGRIENEDGSISEMEIPLNPVTPTRNGQNFTLAVCIDDDLTNKVSDWHYDNVRLQVTRKAPAGSGQIGAAAEQVYHVTQRLPQIGQPQPIGRDTTQLDSADGLFYTVHWTEVDDTVKQYVQSYELHAIDEETGTELPETWIADGTAGSLTINLEQYQGQKLRFYVVAHTNDATAYFDSPNGQNSELTEIVTRADAPTGDTAVFAPAGPNQYTFLNELRLDMTLDGMTTDGSVFFTGFLFDSAERYNTAVAAVNTWQNATGTAKTKAYADLQTLLEVTGTRVIPADSATVGSDTEKDTDKAYYTFTPDGDGFTMTPDNARQYLLPAVRNMPADSAVPSDWHFLLQGEEAARLPGITLDTPAAAHSHTDVTRTLKLYSGSDRTDNLSMGTAAVAMEHFTVEWQAVNAYTENGVTRNLTDSYRVMMTNADDTTATLDVLVYDRDTTGPDTDDDGNKILHKRGEIISVKKTATGEDGQTYEKYLTPDENGVYDLSLMPDFDEEMLDDGTVQYTYKETWSPRSVTIKGTVVYGDTTPYYAVDVVPTLEVMEVNGQPVYRITLPDLRTPVGPNVDQEDKLEAFTKAVTVQAMAHSGDTEGKTVESETARVDMPNAATQAAVEPQLAMFAAALPVDTAADTEAATEPPTPTATPAPSIPVYLPMQTPETAAAG